MDELKQIWKTQSPASAYSRQELETVLRERIASETKSIIYRGWIDLIMALVVTGLIILTAFLMDLKNASQVSLVMIGFTSVMITLHLLKNKAFKDIWRSSESITAMIHKLKTKMSILIWGYRILIPLFTILLYVRFTLDYTITSLWHILWILPLVIALAEWMIHLMYGKNIRILTSLYEEWDNKPTS
jgi:hypothetical protein